MVYHKVANFFPAGRIHVKRIIEQVANKDKLLQACSPNYLDELLCRVLSVLQLLVLQAQICNFTFNFRRGFQVIILLEVEADNVGHVLNGLERLSGVNCS